jgi:hypothetical protein
MRQPCRIRGQKDSKSDTYTEDTEVYVAGINVKECARYPGRSEHLPLATRAARRGDGCSEVSRGHNRRVSAEGLNARLKVIALTFEDEGDAE